MPIYEYACDKCGAQFEVTQKITASPLKRHNGPSKCGGKLRKLMSSNAFHLKGTGWYKTDYADKEKERKNTREKTAKKEAKKDEKKPASASSEKSSSDSASSGKEKATAKSDD